MSSERTTASLPAAFSARACWPPEREDPDRDRDRRERGTSMLLVEQNATVALAVAHSGYIMENGKIVIDGTAERLANDPDVREFYLGMGGGGEAKSFKDIKHYKRRKRWLS